MSVNQKLSLVVGMLPYSDDSGYRVTAKIERIDEGVMLRIDMAHNIPIDYWYIVRDTIDTLVESATKFRTE